MTLHLYYIDDGDDDGLALSNRIYARGTAKCYMSVISNNSGFKRILLIYY